MHTVVQFTRTESHPIFQASKERLDKSQQWKHEGSVSPVLQVKYELIHLEIMLYASLSKEHRQYLSEVRTSVDLKAASKTQFVRKMSKLLRK